MAKKPRKKPKKVDSLKHSDKRKNIPTEELRDFAADAEDRPPAVLYPRDPSLDPQLVWKGKDEQDAQPLDVPAVPIYIQEKIQPRAIIEDLRKEAASGKPRQADLFADFNGLPEDFADRVDFYRHEANWSNRMILGDSLLVMTSLAEKEGLKGKVQMIYIDPPYGIRFGSNWQVSTRRRDVRDGRAQDTTRQPEQIRAFRDTWQLGIHSYLAYWRDRLVAARELLTESGSIFVQIGDENVHLVRCLMDEVLGTGNFAAEIVFQKTTSASAALLAGVTDRILWYAKDRPKMKYRQLHLAKEPGESGASQYRWAELPDGSRKALHGRDWPQGLRPFVHDNITSQRPAQGADVRMFPFRGSNFAPGRGTFKSDMAGLRRLALADRLLAIGDTLRYVRFLDDFPVYPLVNLWADTVTSGFADTKVYVVQTGPLVVQRCLLMATDPGDLVVDPTCGSGTMAYVAEQWGRRWITIDTSRVALALARTRLMAGRFAYYTLTDSPEGLQKEAEATGQPAPRAATHADIRKGFVYQRVPHVMLKDIANNEEIDEVHQKWQPRQDAERATLNEALGESWEDWEVPREADRKWAKDAKQAHAEFWRLRRERQAEMDASIARHSQQEILYDQPYVDNTRVRVSGPFTVESLSPHRRISVDEKKRLAEVGMEGATFRFVGAAQFGNIIIENLQASGVSNRAKGERLKFDRLEPHAGMWVHAEGEYTDRDGTPKRVAVCIGPEHGTVGPQLIKEAAKEAVQGIGFDTLIVCGFSFDPHVSEEARRYGKLTVLPAEIDKDLQFGGDYLKKSGSAALFTVYAEPDIEVRDAAQGRIEVEIRGLDVYDPTTGEIRSNSTDDIACWFIDTDYDGESFFVRHAYFSGADDPYDKLKRALRAEIDEDAWAALYSTVSRPFDRPDTGRIAVKVINHYGDEVLKVYEVSSQ
jgi:adenine-specific DNA-methyltransferase